MVLNLKQVKILSKYPWTKEAKEFIKELNLTLESLESEEYKDIIEAAYNKLKEIIVHRRDILIYSDPFVELLSFVVMQIFISSMKIKQIAYIYATAQQKKAYEYLLEESNDFLVRLAQKEFDWKVIKINQNIGGIIYEYKLKFTDYLKIASGLKDKYWLLTNKILSDGFVLLQRRDLVRLLSEAIKKKILKVLLDSRKIKVPVTMEKYIPTIVKIFEKHAKREFILKEQRVIFEAFPPCLKKLLNDVRNGINVSHLGRFALTSFLLGIGMDVDSVLSIFKNTPDFDDNIARYQVEHIAGLRGSGKKYTPPSCKTLQAFNLCPNPLECKNYTHPFKYYYDKIRKIRGKSKTEKQDS